MVFGVLTGWLERREREAIAYLIEENRLLRRQLGGRRLRLTDADRRRLAARAHRVGRTMLREIATIACAYERHSTHCEHWVYGSSSDSLDSWRPSSSRCFTHSAFSFAPAHRCTRRSSHSDTSSPSCIVPAVHGSDSRQVIGCCGPGCRSAGTPGARRSTSCSR